MAKYSFDLKKKIVDKHLGMMDYCVLEKMIQEITQKLSWMSPVEYRLSQVA